LSFFDSIVSAVGSVAGTINSVASSVARVIPAVGAFIPTPSTISSAIQGLQTGARIASGITGGGFAGTGQAQPSGFDSLVSSFSSVLGGSANARLPMLPATRYRDPVTGGSNAPFISGAPMLNPALLNQGPARLPTTINLRPPSTQFSLGGPYGINYLSSGGGGGSFTPPSGYAAGSITTVGQYRSMLLQQASAAAGFRISWKKLLYILLHFGIEIAKKLTQLDDSAILWLWSTRPHRGRRGPHLNTIAKRARQVQSYRHRIARIARILGAGRHFHQQRALPPPRRRSRR
jgi:hypothetical protein